MRLIGPAPIAGKVSTAAIDDDAITEAKMATDAIGITELKAGTDGNVISFDASGDPVAIATGDDGQVLTSAGAGQPPAFEDAAGGAWNLIGTATASASASITVSGLSTSYKMYAIGISDLKIATDAQDIHLRMGDSGGIDSGASDYGWFNTAFTSDADSTGGTSSPLGSEDNADSFICISGQNNAVGNATTEGFGGMWFVTCAGAGTNLPSIIGNYTNTNQNGGLTIGMSGGLRTTKISLTQIQIFAQSGNLTSGTMTVWGIATA